MKYSLASIFLVFALVADLVFVNSAPSTCEIIHKLTGEQRRLDCLLDPEAVEGPYHLDEMINRSNITEGKPGVPYLINLVIMNSINCEPIPNAYVDIWHAEAMGRYSGFASEGTANETWLRGQQQTDINGEVNFRTVFPGWYTGRCLHIHVEVNLGGELRHVGQMYFNNGTIESVRSAYPYNTRNDTEILQNENDPFFNSGGGQYTIFDTPQGTIDSGFSSVMYIGINPNAIYDPEQRKSYYY